MTAVLCGIDRSIPGVCYSTHIGGEAVLYEGSLMRDVANVVILMMEPTRKPTLDCVLCVVTTCLRDFEIYPCRARGGDSNGTGLTRKGAWWPVEAVAAISRCF